MSSYSKTSVFVCPHEHVNPAFSKTPLWRPFSETCVFRARKRRLHVNGRPKRKKLSAVKNIRIRVDEAWLMNRQYTINTMTSFDNNWQNASGFCFLAHYFRAFAIEASLGLLRPRPQETFVFENAYFFSVCLAKHFYLMVLRVPSGKSTSQNRLFLVLCWIILRGLLQNFRGLLISRYIKKSRYEELWKNTRRRAVGRRRYFKEAMIRGYCCFKSILRWSHHLGPLPIDKMFL